VNSAFKESIDTLIEAGRQFDRKEIKSVQYSVLRGKALCDALDALASSYGIQLQKPLHIDSRGDIRIVAVPVDGSRVEQGAGPFGESFATALNQGRPRTGIPGNYPPATLDSENGWCYMNHFNLEKMLIDLYKQAIGKNQTK
jgi:hypothetical protein